MTRYIALTLASVILIAVMKEYLVMSDIGRMLP
jgi:hypothetical protein